MLIDEVDITVTAGAGGRGAVAFNKNAMSLGPTGGSGGNGGSIYMEGVSDISALKQFRFKKELKAQDGLDGRDQFRDGHDGADLILKIPVGTVLHNTTTSTDKEIVKIGERLLVVSGGHGGKGNFLFRSSRNTSPTRFQSGLSGEQCALRLELKLIADVGFVGLPNVGKSSLLNELTNAHSKVANYQFTTLEPNLGAYHDLILADIPGLIEGAAGGRGLGIKFLRHIERTRVLFHLVGADSENPTADYKIIREELGEYSKELLTKKEYVFISKSDSISRANVRKILAKFKVGRQSVIPISIHDASSMKVVEKILAQITQVFKSELSTAFSD